MFQNVQRVSVWKGHLGTVFTQEYAENKEILKSGTKLTAEPHGVDNYARFAKLFCSSEAEIVENQVFFHDFAICEHM
jgi:hypothetical protein